jgi:hypothetical protein
MLRHFLMRIPFSLMVLMTCIRSAGAESIVLESYAGKRPSNAIRLLSPVLDEMTGRGFLVGPGRVGSAFEERQSRPGGALGKQEMADVTRLVDDGYRAWQNGDFRAAIEKLTLALRQFDSNPAVVARERSLPVFVMRALVGYALAHRRLGHSEDAERAMSELVRSFSDAEFSRASYGPEAQAFYDGVKQSLEQRGRGSLVVEVDDPRVIIFLNEHFEGTAKIDRRDLLPGTYRVFVRRGDDDGRVHIVNVEPNREAKLRIEWAFDTAFVSSPGWTGFAFGSAEDKAKLEAPYAMRVARMLDANGVVVLGLGQADGRPAVVGSVLSMESGRPIRSASIALEPTEPSAGRLRALGRFLAGGAAEEGIHVEQVGLPGAVDVVPGDGGARRFGAWKWVAAGGAIATIATGAWLISFDGHGTDCPPGPGQCPYYYETTSGGVALSIGGVVLGGLATWMFFHDRPKDGATQVGFGPLQKGAGLWVTGEF